MDDAHIIPPPDPLASLLGYHLRRLSVAVMADLANGLAPLDLKPADASILLLTGARPGLTQSELGRALGIQRANMAPLIGALIRRGLLERAPVDGRSQSLRLTPEGEALRARAWAATQMHEARMFGKIPAAERATLITQLRAIWHSAEAGDA
jgi:DNA-binding MarR family transcriptional regulator